MISIFQLFQIRRSQVQCQLSVHASVIPREFARQDRRVVGYRVTPIRVRISSMHRGCKTLVVDLLHDVILVSPCGKYLIPARGKTGYCQCYLPPLPTYLPTYLSPSLFLPYFFLPTPSFLHFGHTFFPPHPQSPYLFIRRPFSLFIYTTTLQLGPFISTSYIFSSPSHFFPGKFILPSWIIKFSLIIKERDVFFQHSM